MRELLRTERLATAVIRLSCDWRYRTVTEENALFKYLNEKIGKICPTVPKLGIHLRKARSVEYELEGGLKIKATLNERVYSFGVVSTSIKLDSRLISSSYDAEELLGRINRSFPAGGEDSVAEAFVNSDEVLIRTPCEEVAVMFDENPPSELAIELVLAKSLVFLSPAMALSSRESVLISVFLFSPKIWSSKRFISDGRFLSTYRKLAKALKIPEKYDDFVSSVLFLKNVSSFYWVLEAIRDLSFLSVGPPKNSELVFCPPAPFLNSMSIRVLNALAIKKALDSLEIKPRKGSSILVTELCPLDERNLKRTWLFRSLSRRRPSKGLTIRELVKITGADWNTIKKVLEGLMVSGFVLCNSTEAYNGKGRPPKFYTVNADHPFIKSLLHGILSAVMIRAR